MNKYDFTALLKSPAALTDADTEKLKELVKTYPYFSLGRNLLVKSLHKAKHYEYDTQLKQAALLCGNRSVLYNLVHDLPLDTDSSSVLNQQVESLDLAKVTDEIESSFKDNIAEIIPEEPKPLVASIVETVDTPVNEFVPEPIKEVIAEPIAELIPEPVAELIPEPVAAIIPEPIAEIIPEPIIELIPHPVIEQIEEVHETSSLTTSLVQSEDEEVTANEELVKPVGEFIKFVPIASANNNEEATQSLIANLEEKEDNLLADFDISSLNDLGSWKPAEPLYQETPAFDEAANKEEENPVVPLLSEVLNIATDETPASVEVVQPIIEPVEEIVPAAEIALPEQGIEEAILEPILEPTYETPIELINEVIPEPVKGPFVELTGPVTVEKVEEKEENVSADFFAWLNEKKQAKPVIEEDHHFVNAFTKTFAEQSNESLTSHINAEVEPASEPKAPNLLESLETYEVDIFLAPVYRNAAFNMQAFDHSFEQVYPEWAKPLNLVKPKITPEPIPEPEVKPLLEPTFDQLPIIDIPKPTPPPIKKPDPPAPKVQRDPSSVESILDKFIRENPSIARPKSEFYNPVNMARQSAESDEELVSETLANIYLRQGLHKKALQVYEKLGLLYPDKIAYFANLIQKVKNENNLD